MDLTNKQEELLKYLTLQSLTVSELTDKLGWTSQAVSSSLSRLKKRGIVQRETYYGESKWIMTTKAFQRWVREGRSIATK